MARRRLMMLVVAALALLGALPAAAEPVGNPAFQAVWARTDRPVAELHVSRTWMWGPAAYSNPTPEAYVESPNGRRTVQYFDKSRMEINQPGADPTGEWYVTNGLLAREMLTGQIQFGENLFATFPRAQVNVAGDVDDPNGVTYATMSNVMGSAPLPNSAVITQTIDHNGDVADGGALGGLLAQYHVSAVGVSAPTHHTVASVFWDFMNSSGLVYDSASGQEITAPLYSNPFYVAGYPLTEAYWTIVRVGGEGKRVLVQVFERRVMTYTPDNPAGWQVEAGNVGQHYYAWRYGQLGNPTAAGVAATHNCGDFPSQLAAQLYFDFRGGSAGNNIEGLDSNRDGVPCESNPAPYSSQYRAQHPA
ncbi:MAG TPA: hypothetical protein VFI42_14175 [Thermomicrobiaceae bacterium]|nr:hypothetical protein [Thermomicrobiaceae bacterium]